MTTQLRFVAFGIITPTSNDLIICDDLWLSAIREEMDAAPEQFDWGDRPRLSFYEAELDELNEGMSDDEWHARGQW